MLTIRVAWRSLAERPVLLGVVVVMTGFAVAVTTALLTVVHGLFWRPLPYRNADRIVRLDAPPANFMSKAEAVGRVTETARTTPRIAARCTVKVESPFQPGSPALTEWGLRAAAVSPECFELFGVQPVLGRVLSAEDRARNPRPLLISEEVWRKRFGSDPTIVDRIIDIPTTLDAQKWVIVGVAPAQFGLPSNTNCWYRFDRRDFLPSIVPEFALLSSATDINALRAELPGVTVTSLSDFLRPDSAHGMTFLVIAMAVFLLVAFVQVGSLLFARAIERVPELAVHVAFGATAGRVLGRFATESAILSLASLVLAAALTRPILFVVISWLPVDLTTGRAMEPDLTTFIGSISAATLGFALWSLIPLAAARRADPSALLRGTFLGVQRAFSARVRLMLLVAQVALGVTLVYTGGLVLQSFARVTALDLGFEPTGLTAVPVPFPVSAASTSAQERRSEDLRNSALATQFIASTRRLSGVAGATFSHALPMTRGTRYADVSPDAYNVSAGLRAVRTQIAIGYPTVIGARLVDGREPTPSETEIPREGATSVPALVNQSLAKLLARDGPVVGRSLWLTPAYCFKVYGVIGDVKQGDPAQAPEPTVYQYQPDSTYSVYLLVRSDQSAATLTRLRQMMRDLWGSRVDALAFIPLDRVVWDATIEHRGRAAVMVLVIVFCLPIMGLGVHGATAAEAARSWHNMAIELALGATPQRIRRRLLLRIVGVVSVGVALGLVTGIGVGVAIASRVFGVTPFEPTAALIVVTLVVVIAGLASRRPAAVIARSDPATLLRQL
jgi:putative ABC transport system permease protein